MKINLKCLLGISILLSSFASAQELTGIKYIGGSSADYPGLVEAIQDLNANGVGTGGVTFIIAEGNYEGSAEIKSVGSVNAPVIFESANANYESVRITSATAAPIKLNKASYITLRNLSIDYTGSGAYPAILLSDSSNNVLIESCYLDGTSATGSQYANSVVYGASNSAASDCKNIQIINNIIRNGSYGVCLRMSNRPKGLSVNNNIFEQNARGGILAEKHAAVIISGNIIRSSQSSSTNYTGIELDDNRGAHRISSNYIHTIGSGIISHGINIQNTVESQPEHVSIVDNNSIQVANPSSLCYGIYQAFQSTNYIFAHNTIYISSGSNAGNTCLRSFAKDLSFIGNVFVNASTGTTNTANRTIDIANSNSISASSYNCFWTVNSGNPFRGRYAGATSFEDIMSASRDTGSIILDPEMVFVDGKGWRASNKALEGAMPKLPYINEDIDGQPRKDSTTIGAHEVEDLHIGIQTPEVLQLQYFNGTLQHAENFEGTADLKLYSLNGQLLIHHSRLQFSAGRAEIPGADQLPAGIYIILAQSRGKLFQGKVFISKQ